MKIMHLLNHTNQSNGHVHAALDLACEQSKRGHTVLIGSSAGDFDSLLEENKVRFEYLSHSRKLHSIFSEIYKFFRAIKKHRPDIVHAHMMTSAILAWPSCIILGVPLVTTVHNEFERSAIFMGLGKRVIAVSEAVKDSMARRGIRRSKIRVVLNGTIGSARMQKICRSPKRLGNSSVIFVGGLHPRKGLIDLFDAMDIIYRSGVIFKLFIVGDGPMKKEYMDYVSRLSCANAIEFLGTKKQPFPYLAGADIFVLPSHADPAPLVISEAREANCAVIATDVDGIPQLLDYGESGILVPPREPNALASEIMQLLRSPDKLSYWKEKSQFNIRNLTISRVCDETLAIYMEVL